MKKTTVQEKRIFLRTPITTNVVFEDEFGEGLFYVKSIDISMGGIFLESSIPARVGSLLFLSLILPSHKKPIKMTGQVVRLASQEVNSSGMGIRFVGLSDEARNCLEQFLTEK